MTDHATLVFVLVLAVLIILAVGFEPYDKGER